jgi:hypothetical protein
MADVPVEEFTRVARENELLRQLVDVQAELIRAHKVILSAAVNGNGASDGNP